MELYYYEFNKPYYSLIKASSMEKALKVYNKHVYQLKGNNPSCHEISKGKACSLLDTALLDNKEFIDIHKRNNELTKILTSRIDGDLLLLDKSIV